MLFSDLFCSSAIGAFYRSDTGLGLLRTIKIYLKYET